MWPLLSALSCLLSALSVFSKFCSLGVSLQLFFNFVRYDLSVATNELFISSKGNILQIKEKIVTEVSRDKSQF